MKIEFTRAEIERIILAHANAIAPYEQFNTVEGSSYRDLPDSIVVSTDKMKALVYPDAAQ
jgi:hypothetical protein